MALTVSKASQLTLFKGLFGENHAVTLAMSTLIDQGAKIDSSLYVVKITHKGQTYSQSLTTGTSALLKGTVSDSLLEQNKFLLKHFVEKVVGVTLGPVDTGATVAPASKFILPPENVFQPAVGMGQTTSALGELLKKKLDQVATAHKLSTSNEVVKLAFATELGQSVEGTSSGSVYRVVAFSNRVKIAAKITGSDISIRVETVGATSQELQVLKTVFVWKGGYGSMHLGSGGVPVYRTLGAFLFDMGIEFNAMAFGTADLKKIYE